MPSLTSQNAQDTSDDASVTPDVDYNKLLIETFLTTAHTEPSAFTTNKPQAKKSVPAKKRKPNIEQSDQELGFLIDTLVDDISVNIGLLHNEDTLEVSEIAVSYETRFNIKQQKQATYNEYTQNSTPSTPAFYQNNFQERVSPLNALLASMVKACLEFVSHPLSVMALVILGLILTPIILIRRKRY
ncbi:MAG: hypothetical protein HOM11_14570 [Methylococcales bacterium]|jgi:hypothetical protein|nr:hypothetical protein [Methylococcales bacterium]MBT7445742.1 hypothetical protein [Methylococcales bacterium]